MISILPLYYDKIDGVTGKRFIDGYVKILELNKIPYKILIFDNSDEFWNDIKNSSIFIARWRGIDNDLNLMQAILPEIENMGVTCLPNYANSYHCGDKFRLATHYAANNMNSPTTNVFLSLNDFLDWVNKDKFPLIAKLIQGAGSRNVMKIENLKQAKRLATKTFSNGIKQGLMQEAVFGFRKTIYRALISFDLKLAKELYHKLRYRFIDKHMKVEKGCLILQEYFPSEYDTRITIIGNRAFGFRRFNRKNDFRASGSGNIDYSPSGIDNKMLDMAFKISDDNNYQTMAYDFIYDKNNNPALIEMNHTFVDSAVAKCPVYWNREGVKIDNKNRYPQYWQLVDILNKPDLIHF